MKITIVLVTALFIAGCERQSVNWPKAVDCVLPHGTIIEDVSSVLLADGTDSKLSSDSRQALANLGAQYGYQSVSCALAWAVDNLLRVMPVKHDGDTAARQAAVARAEAFVAEEGIR